jgi:hypothetical protein
MPSVLRPLLVVVRWLLLASCLLPPPPAAAEDVAVRIERAGDEFILEGAFHVAVAPAVAWAVLTDYEGMPAFVEDLRESRVVERDGDRLRVVQRGVTRLGPFSFDYDVEREVTLESGHALHSRALRGNVKKLDMHTLVDPEGAGTRIRFRAAMIPDFWVPPLVGARLIRARFERQFDSLLKEMRRRAEAAGR